MLPSKINTDCKLIAWLLACVFAGVVLSTFIDPLKEARRPVRTMRAVKLNGRLSLRFRRKN